MGLKYMEGEKTPYVAVRLVLEQHPSLGSRRTNIPLVVTAFSYMLSSYVSVNLLLACRMHKHMSCRLIIPFDPTVAHGDVGICTGAEGLCGVCCAVITRGRMGS